MAEAKVREMKRLFTDSKVCTGCRYCEAVCSLTHVAEVNPSRALIRIKEEVEKGLAFPIVCKLCAKPRCVEACVFDAMERNPERGIILINQKCTGCLACLEACPFGAIFYDEQQQVAVVCDMCQGDPACAKFCRTLPHNRNAALTYASPEQWAKLRGWK